MLKQYDWRDLGIIPFSSLYKCIHTWPGNYNILKMLQWVFLIRVWIKRKKNENFMSWWKKKQKPEMPMQSVFATDFNNITLGLCSFRVFFIHLFFFPSISKQTAPSFLKMKAESMHESDIYNLVHQLFDSSKKQDRSKTPAYCHKNSSIKLRKHIAIAGCHGRPTHSLAILVKTWALAQAKYLYSLSPAKELESCNCFTTVTDIEKVQSS